MVSISITGSRGGIGTSTFAWALARVSAAHALLDYSSSQALHWVIGKPDLVLDWPSTLDSLAEPPDIAKLLSNSNSVEGVQVFSGGQPIGRDFTGENKLVIIDGDCSADFQIHHTTNAFQDIESSNSKADYVVMRQVRGGVPLRINPQKFDYAYRSESNVSRSLNNGLGLHTKSRVQKIAKQISADILRDTSTNH